MKKYDFLSHSSTEKLLSKNVKTAWQDNLICAIMETCVSQNHPKEKGKTGMKQMQKHRCRVVLTDGEFQGVEDIDGFFRQKSPDGRTGTGKEDRGRTGALRLQRTRCLYDSERTPGALYKCR